VSVPGAHPDRDAVQTTLDYHGRISQAMTVERTALASALIPVTPYIIVSAIEAYRRYPEMMRTIAAAMDPAEIGRLGRRPGNQIDPVHLWSIANIPLVGRQVFAPAAMLDPAIDLPTLATVFDFWEPIALAYRGDGTRQAWDAGLRTHGYDAEIVDRLVAAARPVTDADTRAAVGRANAALTSFLFLLYFDTRAGYQDTGPYDLGDGRVLLVRDFNEFGVGHFPWSGEVCGDLPHSNLTLGLVLRDVAVTCNDWGTSITDPSDYLEHLEALAIVDPTDGGWTEIGLDALADITASVHSAQRALYRLIAGMSRKEKIDAGAYVYFSFLLPFARVAGVEHDLDWTVPRDSLDLYELVSMIDEAPAPIEADPNVPYYPPVA
jgi:hypothetical protein